MVQIIPAVLATTEQEYKEKIEQINSNPGLEGGWVQIDFTDGKFVQSETIGVDIVAKYPTNLKKEAHLMVDVPNEWIDQLINEGFKRIVVPIEEISKVDERITRLREQGGIEVGLALNPETGVEKAEQFMAKIDVVLLLSVKPGYQGQEFIPETFEKVKQLKKIRDAKNPQVLIEVDGGIDEEVAPSLVEAGADILVVGSHLLKGDIDANLENFWEAIRR